MTEFITKEELKPYCAGFSDAQLTQAKNICDSCQLTPTKRQVHFSLRNKKDESGGWTKELTFLVTVDGLRGIAERGGAYQGQVGPFWCGSDGVWKDVWLSNEPPAAAKIGVYKTNFREALYAVAKFDEYKQTTKDGNVTGMWLKMPATMVAKCAEALAIRRAFPDETSGIYTVEEMQQAEKPAALDPKEGLENDYPEEQQTKHYNEFIEFVSLAQSYDELADYWNKTGRRIYNGLKSVKPDLATDLKVRMETAKQHLEGKK